MKVTSTATVLVAIGLFILGISDVSAQTPAAEIVGTWVTTRCLRVPNPPGTTMSTRSMTYEITFTSSGTFHRSGTLYIGGVCTTSGWGAQSFDISDGGTYTVGTEIATRDGTVTELDLKYPSSTQFTIFRIDADRLILGDPKGSQTIGDSAATRLDVLGRTLVRKPTAP
ncbi:MAG: hypothetical protein JNL01_13280 [Bdellovibrionales bacterium]|nr:hypothetical protein [Bdellovibrionales bacterium]